MLRPELREYSELYPEQKLQAARGMADWKEVRGLRQGAWHVIHR
jgi:hypothetical protein